MAQFEITFAIGGTITLDLEDPNDSDCIQEEIEYFLSTYFRNKKGKESPIIWVYDSIHVESVIDPFD